MIRTHLTFDCDPSQESAVRDRLDDILVAEFEDIDVHTRWVAELSDSPLFGAAKPKQLGQGLAGTIDSLRAVVRATPAPASEWVRMLLDRTVTVREALSLPETDFDKAAAVDGAVTGLVLLTLRVISDFGPDEFVPPESD